MHLIKRLRSCLPASDKMVAFRLFDDKSITVEIGERGIEIWVNLNDQTVVFDTESTNWKFNSEELAILNSCMKELEQINSMKEMESWFEE